MESEYKIIKYLVHQDGKQEPISFDTKEFYWLDARNKAIELALQWANETNQISVVRVDMYYGIESDIEHTYLLNIMNGEAESKIEAIQLLQEELTALEYMGYQFEDIVISNIIDNEARIMLDKYREILRLFA